MLSPSLYVICLRRIYTLLQSGMWKTCQANPFSSLADHIVEDLMKLALQLPQPHQPKIDHVFLLLTSGRLRRLDLTPFDLEGESALLTNVILSSACRSLRVLTWKPTDSISIGNSIQIFLGFCTNLEEFHSNLRFDLCAFWNCEKLKILKFYGTDRSFMVPTLYNPINAHTLSSLRNLEECSLPGFPTGIIAAVLDNCPKLVSMGPVDLLNALAQIHEKSMNKYLVSRVEVRGHFKIEKCCWGERCSFSCSCRDRYGIIGGLMKRRFHRVDEKIRIAVLSCPRVQKLFISVCNENSIKYLKDLEQLNILSIDFTYADRDYMPHFVELLQIIGPQLLHLSVKYPNPFPLDFIFDFCPNLESLDVAGCATAGNPTQPCIRLRNLRLYRVDRESLLCVLSRCKYLKVLFLPQVPCFDDNLMKKILRLNPLVELKVAVIRRSSLTSEGFRMILEKATSLERVFFSSNDQPYTISLSIVKRIMNELNLNQINCMSSDEFGRGQFFNYYFSKEDF